MNTALPVFSIRCFRYRSRADNVTFTTTLVLDKRVVAKIHGQLASHEADRISDFVKVDVVDPFYWSEFERYAQLQREEADGVDDACTAWLVNRANAAYHERRRQVISLRTTTFRLHDDQPGAFRYLRHRPYSLEVEGWLRMTYGKRLETIYRNDDAKGGQARQAA